MNKKDAVIQPTVPCFCIITVNKRARAQIAHYNFVIQLYTIYFYVIHTMNSNQGHKHKNNLFLFTI